LGLCINYRIDVKGSVAKRCFSHGVRLLTLGLVLATPAPLLRAVDTSATPGETPAQKSARLQWWRDARFGMFIHWGLYSVAAGEWQGKASAGAGEWLMNDLQIPVSQYAKIEPQFNPEKFDARAWVRLAKSAGMKYIVITTKHHDGFGLFRSSLTDWCIKSTPFKREPLKELAQACQAEGIRLGFYHSIMDWHDPDYLPRKSWNDLANSAPDFDRYVAYLKGQLKELLIGYGPISVLWFDGQWENTWTYERGADLYNYVRGLQPNIIINNRVGTEQPLQPGQRRFGDYKTPEQSIPPNGLGPDVDWETCMTMNNTWGFKKADNDWKSTQTLVRNLIDCASKGGNYLLNVGPTGEGLIPEASIERLKQIGQWMSKNGQSIYQTSAGPFKRSLGWGRCTAKISGKLTTLYIHVFDWPSDGELLLPGLRNSCQSAWLLADPEKKSLPVETGENGLTLKVPKIASDPISTTLVVRLEGTPNLQPIILVQKLDGSLVLPASDGRLHGTTFQYESGAGLDNIGYWTTPEDWVDWEFKLNKPGRFAVTAVIAALASGSFEVSVAGQTLRCAAPVTGSYTNFKPVSIGTIELPSGKAVLTVRPIKEGWQPMNLKAIHLNPAPANS
jgi:alpha-L-fucosidase